MTVSVICEECGKVYHVPKAKLDQIKGDVVKTKCKDCGHIIEIQKEEKNYAETHEYDSLDEVQEDAGQTDFGDEDFDDLEKAFEESAQEVAQEVAAPAPDKKQKAWGKKKFGLGLRVKMMILFMVIPLLLMSVSAFLTQRQMNVLTHDITSASADLLKRMGERNIAETGQAVARQCKMYLDAHPDISREDFAADMTLSKLAIQKVGKTGYTVLSSVGPFVAWVHPNPKLNGVQLTKVIKKLLGSNYHQFAKIISNAEKGRNIKSDGYYLWKDVDGKMREKYMTLTPIPGTAYNIAATTYIHEFTSPVKSLETQAESVALSSRNLNLITIAGTLVIIGLIVTLYGHSVITKIRHLTNVADRISVGELDAQIKIQSKDEIGNLAEAIARMQDSLRLSIERLRKKR